MHNSFLGRNGVDMADGADEQDCNAGPGRHNASFPKRHLGYVFVSWQSSEKAKICPVGFLQRSVAVNRVPASLQGPETIDLACCVRQCVRQSPYVPVQAYTAMFLLGILGPILDLDSLAGGQALS